MRLNQGHQSFLAVFLESDDLVGIGHADIAKTISSFNSYRIAKLVTQLEEAGYVEARFEGEPWPGEKRSPNDPANPKKPRRLYRITAAGKEAFMGRG